MVTTPYYTGQDFGPKEGMAYTTVMPQEGFKYVYDQAGTRHSVPTTFNVSSGGGYTSLYKDDPIAEELAAGIQGIDVYQGSPYALANVPEFEGIKYATPDYNRYKDLYSLYLGGGFDAEPTKVIPPAAPPASGGGSGDGGAGTDAYDKEEFEQNLIDQGVGVQIAPGQPVVAPGEVPLTNLDIAIANDPTLGYDGGTGEGEFDSAMDHMGSMEPAGEFTGVVDGTGVGQIHANEFADIAAPLKPDPTYDLMDYDEHMEDTSGQTGIYEPPAPTYYDTRDPDLLDLAGGETGGADAYFDDIKSPLPDTSISNRDQAKTNIPTSTDEFDVTTDTFDMPRGGGADFAGVTPDADKSQAVSVDGLDILDVPSTQVLGIGVQPEFDKTFVDSTTGEEMTVASPYTLGNVYTGEFDPNDEGTVFDTTSITPDSITPEDTEQSIKGKIADFLGITEDQVNMAAVTGALNVIGGKVLETSVPIATLVREGVPLVKKGIDKVVDIFTKSPEEIAAEEQARQDNMDEAAEITRRIEEEDKQRRETEAREEAAARAREEAAQRAREEAAERAAAEQRAAEKRARDRAAAEAAARARDRHGGNGGNQGGGQSAAGAGGGSQQAKSGGSSPSGGWGGGWGWSKGGIVGLKNAKR